jgi:dTDP-4-dehydrorhamnose reductase
MKVLITGGNGMLGHAMRDVWADHEVISLDVDELDITNPKAVTNAIVLYRPQAIINCAAYTAVDEAESHEAVADKINGTAVGYLARAAKTEKIPIVHFSTDYVFDGTKTTGYSEDDQPAPMSAYGRTKLHGEQQLRLNAERYYLVRTAWLYGPHGKNFISTMLELGKTKTELKVVNDQHGRPTYTHDLAAYVKSLVLDRAPFGIYHGVNEGEATWFELTQEIFRLAGIATPVLPVTTEEFPRPAKRPHWSILLNTKRPNMRAWRQALRDYLATMGYSV